MRIKKEHAAVDTDKLSKKLTKRSIEEMIDAEPEDNAEDQNAPQEETSSLIPSIFSNGISPILEHYLPPEIKLTKEEKNKVMLGLKRIGTGLSASMPITCYGEKCPFKLQCPLHQIGKTPEGKACHLPGEMIKTSSHGDVKIEELDQDVHTLLSFHRRRHSIVGDSFKQGRKFRRVQRDFSGTVINFSTENNKKNSITFDHIAIARFNEKAVGKFCVYLMQRGGYFRVGKSKLLEFSESSNKYHMPVGNRLKAEDGDALWVLGVYDTNTEALLAEELYSLHLLAPKALFIASNNDYNKRMKTDGLYKWITQGELDAHHMNFVKPTCYWANKLQEMGLSLDYPLFERDNYEKKNSEVKTYAKQTMYIRACNLMKDYMDVPVYPEEGTEKYSMNRYKLVNWETITNLDKEHYEGIVYSLDVEKDKTYFANSIATHNCPIEASLIDLYTKRYIDEFEVDTNYMSELTVMNMLAATHVMEMRAFIILGKDDDESPTGLIRNVVGFNNEEEPIVQLQEHPAFNIIERAWRWRKNLLESLLGTRKEKLKRDAIMGEKGPQSVSTAAADLKSTISKLTIVDISDED